MEMQARISRYIACEEEWLRLLVLELSPVIDHLQENDLPLGESYLTETGLYVSMNLRRLCRLGLLNSFHSYAQNYVRGEHFQIALLGCNAM